MPLLKREPAWQPDLQPELLAKNMHYSDPYVLGSRYKPDIWYRNLTSAGMMAVRASSLFLLGSCVAWRHPALESWGADQPFNQVFMQWQKTDGTTTIDTIRIQPSDWVPLIRARESVRVWQGLCNLPRKPATCRVLSRVRVIKLITHHF